MGGEPLEQRVSMLERMLERHLGGCEEQNKSVSRTLTRLETGINGIYHKAWKAVGAVIGAQFAIGVALFTAWLALRH